MSFEEFERCGTQSASPQFHPHEQDIQIYLVFVQSGLIQKTLELKLLSTEGKFQPGAVLLIFPCRSPV